MFLCPKCSVLYSFIDTSVYKLTHLGVLLNFLQFLQLTLLNLGISIFNSLKNGSSANFYFISKKATSYSLSWSQANGNYSSYQDALTYLSQVDHIRKHIGLQLNLFVEFLPTCNLYTLSLPKLLAGREVDSDATRETPWGFYKYFMMKLGLFFLKKTTCYFQESGILIVLLTFIMNQSLCLMSPNNQIQATYGSLVFRFHAQFYLNVKKNPNTKNQEKRVLCPLH